jgi:hypothetical protein
MIEPSPLDTDTALERIRALRRARFIALRAVDVNERAVQQQLRELDDSTLSTSAQELRMLRAQIDRS